MADQTARQRARRTALDAQARMRVRRVEQERRRDALGVVVVSALVKLTERKGLTLTEAVQCCGGADLLTVREAGWLRQTAQPSAHRRASPAGSDDQPDARAGGAGEAVGRDPGSADGHGLEVSVGIPLSAAVVESGVRLRVARPWRPSPWRPARRRSAMKSSGVPPLPEDVGLPGLSCQLVGAARLEDVGARLNFDAPANFSRYFTPIVGHAPAGVRVWCGA